MTVTETNDFIRTRGTRQTSGSNMESIQVYSRTSLVQIFEVLYSESKSSRANKFYY